MKNTLRFFGFIWSWRHEILVVIIFIAALLLRLQSFGDRHYFYNGDYNRDYLIAHHILAYHGFPLVGPEGGFGSAGNSPAYFYFLALPLLIKDDIVFLGLFNVLLQMGALILVYLLGRMMFGKPVGLGTLAIFAMNENIIYQSNFVWQPHIMQPFLLLSILLLFIAYTRKSYLFFLSSIACFVFSSVLHQSVLALAPFYLIAAFLMLRANQRLLWRHYAGAIVCFVGISILLYAPLLFHFQKNFASMISFSHATSTFFGNNQWIIARFFSRTELLSSVLFVHNAFAQLASNTIPEHVFLANIFSSISANPRMMILLPIMGAFLLLCCFFIYLYGRREKEKKVQFLLIFAAIAQFLAVTAFVESSHFYMRYLTPLFGISVICIVELIYGLIPRRFYGWIVPLVILILILFSSQNISDRLETAIHGITTNPITFFAPQYTPPPFIPPLIQEITAIKEREYRKDFTFFDMRSYRYEKLGYGLAAFWVPLEHNLGVRLVAVVDDNNVRHFSPIGDAQYIFFDCEFAQDASHECVGPFLREHPDFHVIKELTSDPPIYIAKRQVS